MSWAKAEKCPCSYSRAPTDCAAMAGVSPDPALLSCCPLPWREEPRPPAQLSTALSSEAHPLITALLVYMAGEN